MSSDASNHNHSDVEVSSANSTQRSNYAPVEAPKEEVKADAPVEAAKPEAPKEEVKADAPFEAAKPEALKNK